MDHVLFSRSMPVLSLMSLDCCRLVLRLYLGTATSTVTPDTDTDTGAGKEAPDFAAITVEPCVSMALRICCSWNPGADLAVWL